VIRATNHAEVCAIRRRNYAYLLDRVGGCEGVAPLFAALPETVVPYNFPLLCEDAAAVAARLRAHGVSVARFGEFFWDEQDRVPGSVADTYSRNCIQLPIHQSVSCEDLDYMLGVLRHS
jgi:dTDP-4-amino-4,6-dideoxygalactose transaminase